MDILSKVKTVADSLGQHDWKDESLNKNILRIGQMLVEAIYSSYLTKPVQVSSIELKIGSEDSREVQTLQNFCDVVINLNEQDTSSHKPFDKLKHFVKSLQDDFGKRGKKIKQEKNKPKNTANKLERFSACESESKHPEISTQNYNVESLDSSPTKRYGTRRVRKRKMHFDEDEFEISWPKSSKKTLEKNLDAIEEVVDNVETVAQKDDMTTYFTCGNCLEEIRFKTKEEVCNHIQSLHGQGNPIANQQEDTSQTSDKTVENSGCSYCDKSAVKNNTTYRQHIKELHMKKMKTAVSVSCPKCPLAIHDSKRAGKTSNALNFICDHLLDSHNVHGSSVVLFENVMEYDESNVSGQEINKEIKEEVITNDEGNKTELSEEQNEEQNEELNEDEKLNEELNDDLDDTDYPSDDSTFELSQESVKRSKTKRTKTAQRAKFNGGECANCGSYLEGRSYLRHIQRCKKDPGCKKRQNLLQLPSILPLVHCPLCEQDPLELNQLDDCLNHLRTIHSDCMTCPVCSLEWSKTAVRGKTVRQNQRDFAMKILMHFVISHDLLADSGNNEVTSCAADAMPEVEQEAGCISPQTGENTDHHEVNCPDKTDVQYVEHIVQPPSAETSVIQITQSLVDEGASVTSLTSQEVIGQISYIESDTLGSVTTMDSMLVGEESMTIHLIDGELDINDINALAASQNIDLVQVLQENTEKVPIPVGENIDYSLFTDPFPDEMFYTCHICPEKPRHLSRKTFQEHLYHFHVKTDASNKEVIDCPDCDGVFKDIVFGKKQARHEPIVLHWMLHHRFPRPDYCEVLRCPTCQFETVCGTIFADHFRMRRSCARSNEDEALASKEYQCNVCGFNKTKDQGNGQEKAAQNEFQTFIGETAYLNHMKEKHVRVDGEGRSSAQCSVCDRTYNFEVARHSHLKRCVAFLSHHMWQAHDAEVPVQERSIRCPLCLVKSTEGIMYQRHVSEKHLHFREKMFLQKDEQLCEPCSGLLKSNLWDSHQEKCSKIQRALTSRDKVICEICGVSVTYTHYIKTHQMACAGKNKNLEKVIECDQCEKKFYTEIQMQEHVNRSHKQRRTFECHICKATLSGQRSFEEHMMSVHELNIGGRPLIECPICDFRGIVRTVQAHCKDLHGLNFKPKSKTRPLGRATTYICEQCSYRTSTLSAMKSHLAHKHNIGRIDCTLCKYVGKSKQAFDNHMKTVHAEGEEKIVNYCEVCTKQFSSVHTYDNHMFVKHGVNLSKRKVMHCDKCGFKTLGNSLLKVHMKTHERQLFSCDLCDKQFDNKLNYDSHRRRHVKSNKCMECGLMCAGNSHLDRHIARVHREIVWKCEFCNYVTYTERLYRIHLRMKHECSAEVAQTLVESGAARSRSHKFSREKANARSSIVYVMEGEISETNHIDLNE